MLQLRFQIQDFVLPNILTSFQVSCYLVYKHCFLFITFFGGGGKNVLLFAPNFRFFFLEQSLSIFFFFSVEVTVMVISE